MLKNNKPLISWALYDWANSAFSSIIQTFIFAVYFAENIAPNPEIGGALWGVINGIASLLIAISGPIFGSIADHGGKRKMWLFLFTFICIIFTILLSFFHNLSFIIFFSIIAIAASELAFVFYNAMLPCLAPHSHIGRWSGWGWGLGYAGGMLSLVISLAILKSGYPVQLTFLLCAFWYFFFSLPIFFFTPSTSGQGKPPLRAISDGIKQLLGTFYQIKKYKEIVKFLVARMFYVDGLTTLFAFGGIYIATTFGMSQSQVLLFGIMLNISAGIGAVGFSWIDDKIGPRKLIIFSLVGTTIPTLWLLLTNSAVLLWILGFIAVIFAGPIQAGSRSLMARLAPKKLYNEMFGFFAFSGKATSFLGPWIVSWLILQYESMRLGLAVIVVFYVIGGLLMLSVDDQK